MNIEFREHFDAASAQAGLIQAARAKLRTVPSLFDAIAAESLEKEPTKAARAMHELSSTTAALAGTPARGFFVPWADLATRDLNVTTPSAGGYLAPDNFANQMIGALRPHSVALAAGATFVPVANGGTLVFPRLDSGASTAWLDESGSHSASGPDFGQVIVQPRSIAATITVSRRLMMMGAVKAGGVENAIRGELMAAIMAELDRVVLAGSGTDPEPMGVLNNADVEVVAIGANGGAPTWDVITNVEHTVGIVSGDLGAPAWAINSVTRRKLRRTERAAGSGFIMEGREIAGHPAVVSEHLPSDLTKGTGTSLSALVYGDFSSVLVGVWGPGIDVVVDRYTLASQQLVRITALFDVGVALRHPKNFAIVKDIVTS